jgi:hypothetical protein
MEMPPQEKGDGEAQKTARAPVRIVDVPARDVPVIEEPVSEISPLNESVEMESEER